jgi:hypothetical protein
VGTYILQAESKACILEKSKLREGQGSQTAIITGEKLLKEKPSMYLKKPRYK